MTDDRPTYNKLATFGAEIFVQRKITRRRLQKLSLTFGLNETPVEQLALVTYCKGKMHTRTGHEGPEGE
jgi:hypothetical protein